VVIEDEEEVRDNITTTTRLGAARRPLAPLDARRKKKNNSKN
jgi:hypothetical protein